VIPSYNAGPMLRATVADALSRWTPVLVVIDGSTDGSDRGLEAENLTVVRSKARCGKGEAVRTGLLHAASAGFSHALVMDSDGQHPAQKIATMMTASAANPGAMILGQPEFGRDAPWARVRGRRIGNAVTTMLTAGSGLGDSLFGFRVYPIRPLLDVIAETRWMRRFDFDTEAIVRLSWRGVPAVTVPVPVRYLRPEEGGVSHFRYGRDNLLLAWMHLRLCLAWLARRSIASR
jgi:glycosyltransferase involved in cell wall biosynthesis